ncbi:MAG: thioredoxin [Clostridia bacterium]|nr:thioredoxin [Clostridia bacterium]
MEEITSENFDEIINNKSMTVVDFSATWCMPCRMLKPILEKVETQFKDVKFYSLDIDESEDIAKRYRIFSVPSVLCFKDGKKVDAMVGLNPYDDVVEYIKNALIKEPVED